MNVTQVPFEPRRYWVQSTSRPNLWHLVDLDFDGKALCGCEAMFAKKDGEIVPECKHVFQARAFEQLHYEQKIQGEAA